MLVVLVDAHVTALLEKALSFRSTTISGLRSRDREVIDRIAAAIAALGRDVT